MQRFELYNNLLQNGDKSECDELFNESLNKYGLIVNDLNNLTINNKFKQIIAFFYY